MFDTGFPQDWSTLKKLIWLKASTLSASLTTLTGSIVSFIANKAKAINALTVDISSQSGITGLNIYYEDEYDASATPFITVSWEDEVGSITSGTYDAVSGILTTGGDEYQLTGQTISTNIGSNVIWSDVGDVSVTARNITSLDDAESDLVGTGLVDYMTLVT